MDGATVSLGRTYLLTYSAARVRAALVALGAGSSPDRDERYGTDAHVRRLCADFCLCPIIYCVFCRGAARVLAD